MKHIKVNDILKLIKATGDIMTTIGAALVFIGTSAECYKAIMTISKMVNCQ